MTPRTVDWRAIGAKLRTIRELLDELDGLGVVDRPRLDKEPLTALAVERILCLVVDLAFSCNSHVAAALLGRVPETYRDSFSLAAEVGLIDPGLAAELRPSVGLRNVLVHAYLDTDRDIVVAAVPVAVERYGEYVRQVAVFVRDRAS
jgi:uncharacterized protein YutE (UPF0331/DUF86 family)